jgi:hypothetical protein
MKKIVILGDESGFIVSYGNIIFCGKDLKELMEKIEEIIKKSPELRSPRLELGRVGHTYNTL